MTVLRVCYKQGVRFDEQYYVTKHLPLVGAVMGPYGVTKIEMMKVSGSGDGSTAPYQVIFSAYFDSADAFARAMQDPRIPDVMADIQQFHDGTPDVLIGEVVSLPSPV